MEYHEDSDISLRLSNLLFLEELNSPKNGKVELYAHPMLGRVLVMGNEIQHIEAYAPVYHEIITHLPCSFLSNVENVLILGGGDFYMAHEVLKYPGVKKVTQVDHDQVVIDLMLKHYEHPKRIIENPRFELIIDDVLSYISRVGVQFDLIINDAIDLINHEALRDKDIFDAMYHITSEHGICCDLVYRHIFEKLTTRKTIQLLKVAGFNVAFSLIAIPEYPGFLHLLYMWGKCSSLNQSAKHIKNTTQKKWLKKPKQNPCIYYSPHHLPYYLYLPPYLKTIIDGIDNL